MALSRVTQDKFELIHHAERGFCMNIMIIYTRINCGALGGVGTRVYLKIMIGLSGSVIEALHSVSHIASVNALSLHSRAQGIDFNDREPLGHSQDVLQSVPAPPWPHMAPPVTR